jgi:MYXO-CTERM domain-containing protein
MRTHLVLPAVAFAFVSSMARADIIVPEQQACRDKKVGDACDGGICQSDGFSCQAGSCRRHDDETACRADGCSWVEGLSCKAAATPPAPTPTTETTTTKTTTTTTTQVPEPVAPSSCAMAGGEAGFGAALLGLLLARRRRSA